MKNSLLKAANTFWTEHTACIGN